MTGVPVAEKMTAAEFLAQPPSPRAQRRQLVHGEVIVSEPTALHGYVVMNVLFALGTWAREGSNRGQALVPIDVELDRHNVFVPDLLWYSQGKAPGAQAQPPYALPDIAVEVRSPSTWRYNLGAKKAGYEDKGLPELWLIDTLAHTVLVYRRSSAGAPAFDVALELAEPEQLASPLLPGFGVAVTEIFRLP